MDLNPLKVQHLKADRLSRRPLGEPWAEIASAGLENDTAKAARANRDPEHGSDMQPGHARHVHLRGIGGAGTSARRPVRANDGRGDRPVGIGSAIVAPRREAWHRRAAGGRGVLRSFAARCSPGM